MNDDRGNVGSLAYEVSGRAKDIVTRIEKLCYQTHTFEWAVERVSPGVQGMLCHAKVVLGAVETLVTLSEDRYRQECLSWLLAETEHRLAQQ